MKRVNYIITLAACLAALLTSCIKEEAYTLDEATLQVHLTRGDEEAEGSVAQGDGISDVMVWAFKCSLDSNGAPTGVENIATGWRYVSNVNSYGSLADIHIPLPMCDTDKQSYVVVAVLNTEEFGETIDFGASTTYTQLTTSTFDASGSLFWKRNPDDEGLLPENMPVSNWATITVTNANTHPNDCYALDLPVYRAVAKTQLLVKKSSEMFGVVVSDVKVISSSALNKGFILSASEQARTDVNGAAVQIGYPNQTAGPEWWGTPTGYEQHNIQLCNSVNMIGETDEVESIEFLPTGIAYNADAATEEEEYTWVGSAFLYENANEAVANDDYTQITTDNGGYYMQITYYYNTNGEDGMWDDEEAFVENATGNIKSVRYVPLPKVVRNHDYRVSATVSVDVEGSLVVKYKVTDWQTASVDVPSFN